MTNTRKKWYNWSQLIWSIHQWTIISCVTWFFIQLNYSLKHSTTIQLKIQLMTMFMVFIYRKYFYRFPFFTTKNKKKKQKKTDQKTNHNNLNSEKLKLIQFKTENARIKAENLFEFSIISMELFTLKLNFLLLDFFKESKCVFV